MKCLIVLALVFAAEARMQPTVGQSFIIDGSPAAIEDFPTQASLRYSGSHTCGCVHLSESTQLTAAHCVEGRVPTDFDVYYGSSSRTSGGTLASATGFTMHELYGQPDGDNGLPYDIATVAVSVSFDGVTAVAANLPSGNSDFTGATCTITGWGRTGPSGTLPDELQQVSNTILPNPECDHYMMVAVSGPGAGIAPYHICIRDETDQSSGSCNGDNGGPMHCDEGGVTVIAGVKSWGISGGGECLTAYPSVYTRVSYFLDWLPGS